jgi:hypothetical protein
LGSTFLSKISPVSIKRLEFIFKKPPLVVQTWVTPLSHLWWRRCALNVEETMFTKKEQLKLIKTGKVIVSKEKVSKLLPDDVVYHIDNNLEIKKINDNNFIVKLKRNLFYNN